eukprot:129893-Chlamydomonas_euryale.AAC.4
MLRRLARLARRRASSRAAVSPQQHLRQPQQPPQEHPQQQPRAKAVYEPRNSHEAHAAQVDTLDDVGVRARLAAAHMLQVDPVRGAARSCLPRFLAGLGMQAGGGMAGQ